MCKKIWGSFYFLLFLSSLSFGQSFSLGLGVVNSQALGFEEWYGVGVIEVSASTDALQYRLGLEIMNAEKLHQDGWGGRMDLTVTRPLNPKMGVLAFYRPSWIHQTNYDKSAHVVGAGVCFTTKHNGRWDFYAGFAHDEYKQQELGMELRVGHGQWLRVRAESITVTHPSTGKTQRGSRVSMVVAPRIKW